MSPSALGLLLWACSGMPSKPLPMGDSPAVTRDDSAPPTDADADGHPLPEDCDDEDPSVYPGAPEVCDGVDQDCDGEADNGVPNDGAGCQEPPTPTFPDTIGILDIIVRVGTNTNDGTDDQTYVCAGDDHCSVLNNAEWNDLELGAIDKFGFEGVNIPRSEVNEITIGMTTGGDRLVPACLALRFDGEPVYCRNLSILLGNSTSEVLSWSEGLGNNCQTCWPSVLTHGPMVGAVGTRDARLWWRIDGSRRVALRVARTADALTAAAPVHVAWPEAYHDTTYTAHVQGLEPDTVWYYDLEVEGERFGPWTFRTASEAPGPLRVAFGSCTKTDEQPIFQAVRDYAPDVFLFIGDNHYGNTSQLSDLRQFYRWAHERDDRAELLHEASILATWDDHDYTGNNTDGNASGKDNAVRAFSDYWANESYGLDDLTGVFSTHRMGDVEFFLVDDRYYRDIESNILGDAQEAWLFDALEASDATFKLIACGSQFTLDGSDDSWGVWPDAQEHLMQTIADRGVEGVVFLSGDIHRSEMRLLPGVSYDVPEFTSSPMANSNSSCHSSSEIRTCAASDNYFIGIDIDTSVSDPTLEATLFDEDGDEVYSWTILRSALE